MYWTQPFNKQIEVHESKHFKQWNKTGNTLLMLNFDQKTQFFEIVTKNMFFTLFVKNGLTLQNENFFKLINFQDTYNLSPNIYT